ncbi:hypothetical protein [Nocardioides sp.]|uniref:hypothetical protein n=1 Tax=Nocardioides sp. TaxID=35761 RepID=UPI0026043BEB|nr:hypothetical protein [Nocardioides sp.]MCW2737495.1 hypothetical protein [Nocardioides sp.]
MTGEPRVVQARAPYALARALATTVVVVVGALSAHTWAGGTVPTGPGLALVAAVVLTGGLLLHTREVPLWAVLPGVAAAQLGLHESFGLVAEHTHDAVASPDPGWTWQMVAAHAFVTLLTAVLWWASRRAASYDVSFRTHPALPVVAEPRRRRTEARTPVSSLVHLLVSPRRGPPLAVRPT